VSLAILLTILGGCAGTQDYQAVAPDSVDSALTTSEIVLEGHVTNSRIERRARASAWQMLTFWDPLPMPAEPGPPEWNATVRVERILKGEIPTPEIELRNYRPPSAAERQLFPDDYTIHIGTRLRLGFDGFSGRTLRNLRLVPLGYTPAYDAFPRRAEPERGAPLRPPGAEPPSP
jgi:hypothetical protein